MKLVNPEIIWASPDLLPWEEGCLSLPDQFAEVERPREVKIRYIDENNQPQELHAQGLMSVCVQHDDDHSRRHAVRRPYLRPCAGTSDSAQAGQNQETERARTWLENLMRLVFMGTPDFAVPALRALHEAGHEIAAVYTQPPRPAGRGQHEQRSPVHEFAATHRLAGALTPTEPQGRRGTSKSSRHSPLTSQWLRLMD